MTTIRILGVLPMGLALTRIERVHAAPAVAVSWGCAAAGPINVNFTPGRSEPLA